MCNNMVSHVRVLSLGTPQGCVVSNSLFSSYTGDYCCSSPNCSGIKCADDTVISEFLLNDNHEYVNEVQKLVDL